MCIIVSAALNLTPFFISNSPLSFYQDDVVKIDLFFKTNE